MADQQSPASPDVLPAALDYTWNWFSYHANQRFASFNFFVVFVGALAAGYLTSLEQGWPGVAIVLAFFGVMISLAFALLDIRNRELVECARQALRRLEGSYGLSILDDSVERRYLAHRTKFGLSALPQNLQRRLTKHGLIFQGLQYLSAAIFLVAGVYGILRFSWC